MTLSPRAKRFCRSYPNRLPVLKEAAVELEAFVIDSLKGYNFDLHLISARAKSFASILGKIRRKGYRDPARRLTDQLGVRVITYYANDVDRVAVALRARLDVDESKSIDKRTDLNIQEFGYRSVHLIARLRESDSMQPNCSKLKRHVFEVQIRSILEHAWAEIEHETNYKAGINFPDLYKRRFGAIAGALEILESQFLVQKKERDSMIDMYRVTYEKGNDGDVRLDAARLLGLLEARRPLGLSWRQAEMSGSPFPPRLEATCVNALAAVGVTTGNQFEQLLKSRRLLAASKEFAGDIGLAPAEISHLVLCVLAVGLMNHDILVEEYPELVEDISLRAVLGL